MRRELSVRDVLCRADVFVGRARDRRDQADKALQAASAPQPAQSVIEPAVALMRAQRLLCCAVRLLQTALGPQDDDDAESGEPRIVTKEQQQLAAKLADVHGSLGGIARRDGQLDRALQHYHAGAALERDPAYEIQSTYNRGQAIVLQLLIDPAQRDAATWKREANQLLLRLCARADPDVWAAANIVLVAALLGDQDRFENGLAALHRGEPSHDVFSSGLRVLQELQEAMPPTWLLDEAVAWYRNPPKSSW